MSIMWYNSLIEPSSNQTSYAIPFQVWYYKKVIVSLKCAKLKYLVVQVLLKYLNN